MKILFLHISDLHMNKKTDISTFHIQKIVDSLEVARDFEHIIIVISGDVAYSGQLQQYKYARYMFGNLIKQLYGKFKLMSKINVLVVPGNHDVDLSSGDLGHENIQKLFRDRQMENQITSECKKQEYFMSFARGNYCFNNKDKQPLYYRRMIEFDGFTIEANLLNSAIFSTLDEDKGLHYLPQHIINEASEPSGADFVISVMHHSHHWFNEENKAQLDQIFLSKSSLLFLGHEHNLGNQDVSSSNTSTVKILAGGMLCNKGDWTKSEYFASVLDTKDLNYTLFSFKWNAQEMLYSHNLIYEDILTSKPSREKRLVPTEEYLKGLFQDDKRSITKNFSDYFVFPRIQSEEKNEHITSIEIINQDEFMTEFEKKKKLFIAGYENSGKTVLLKQLFKKISENKIALFCDIDSIRSGKFERDIRRIFEDIYGDNQYDYIRFQQMSKQDKVIIIDNTDRVDAKGLEYILKEAENNFEYIICGTKNVTELDILERAKKLIVEEGSYIRYRIMPFFADKRHELISKIVKIKILEDNEEQTKITNILDDSLKKQRSLFNLNPDFIIQYTEYYCNNVMDAIQNDGEVFSKVFEANIVNSIKQHAKRIKVDKLFVIIDKVAYYIHSNKAYPLKQGDLINIINQYNEKYGENINVLEFIQITMDAKILTLCGNGSEYKFCNKNYLAYFIAREIKRRYHEDGDNKDLINILNYSCFGINADILLFLTYITDNLNMLRFILDTTKNCTEAWIEFDLNKGNIPYLTNIKPLDIAAPTADEKKKEQKCEIEEEKHINNKNSLDAMDIYDYSEDDIEKKINQLCRAFSLLNIISRCLPSFEHMMPKEDKERFVDMIYRLPNQIFYLWANEVESNKEELIEFIKELQERDYSRDKKYTDEDIMFLLQVDSMSLFLDILNTAAINSTKENTERYLNSFDYKPNITHSLQHLMTLERREKVNDFIEEVERIFGISKNNMSKTMIKRITRHLMIYSRKIGTREIQKLESKYFTNRNNYLHNGKDHKRLLLQRAKVSKEKR